MQKNGVEKIQSSDLETKSELQDVQGTSENLLKNVSLQLFSMMQSVTKTEINPNTVNAACNCASEIHKLLKFNLEMKRSS